MNSPESPRGWLNFAVSVSNRYEFPHSVKYEYTGKSDPRVDDRKETALSVKMMLERATHGNGAGRLVMDFYVNDVAWGSFTPAEQWHLSRAIRRFRAELIRNGFLPPDR